MAAVRALFGTTDQGHPVEEAVRRADAAPSGVVVLSGTGDSRLGGAAGDSNVLLAELIRQELRGTARVRLVERRLSSEPPRRVKGRCWSCVSG